MKRYSFSLCLVLLAALTSCSYHEEMAAEKQEIRFHGVMETPPETRVYSDAGYKMFWNKGDHVSIFTETTYNHDYIFTGKTGDTAGDFLPAGSGSQFSTGQDLEGDYSYSIFPYQYFNGCTTNGTLRVPFPSEQTFNENSTGIGANLFMVARATDGYFAFKHAAGYIGYKLYGEGVTVASITFKSNNGEIISGDAQVVFTDDGTPYVTFTNGSDVSDQVTIVCDPPVELGATEADFKTFWIALPPTVLTSGMTYTVTDTNGGTFTRVGTASLVVERKVFKTIKARQVIIEGGDTPSVINVSSVQLNESAMSLSVGGTGNLIATVNPSDATDKTVTWTSSNTAIATVDANGKVTAVAPGTAVIVVTTKDGGKTASCTVTVSSTTVPVESITLDKTSLSLAEGETATIIATVSPDNATNKAVNWTSSNTAVATVDANGNVTAVSAGTIVIIASTADGGKTALCTVTVTASAVPVESVSLNKGTLSLEEGASETLTATVNPSNATDKSVTWSSSNSAVATVDANGKVTAVAAGEAEITVTTTDGAKTASCTVTVTASAVAVESVSLNKTELSLIVGAEETLTATVLPENADNKAVTWSSSDESVATVDANGKVKAIAIGEAVITVTTADGGKTATCTVTVTKNPNQPGDPIVIEPEEEL